MNHLFVGAIIVSSVFLFYVDVSGFDFVFFKFVSFFILIFFQMKMKLSMYICIYIC